MTQFKFPLDKKKKYDILSPKASGLQPLSYNKTTMQISKKRVCARLFCNFSILVKQLNCSQYWLL